MHVIEYSISQKKFHIQTISMSLTANFYDALMGRENDYKIIGLAKSHGGACQFVDDLKIRHKEFSNE